MKSIRTSIRIPAVLVLALCCVVQICLAEDGPQLSDAMAAVSDNMKTPQGKRYDAQVESDFAGYLLDLRSCKQSGEGSSTVLDLFLRLKADGKVDEVLIYPDSDFATCTQNLFQSAHFTRPPHGDYWVNIRMRFKK